MGNWFRIMFQKMIWKFTFDDKTSDHYCVSYKDNKKPSEFMRVLNARKHTKYFSTIFRLNDDIQYIDYTIVTEKRMLLTLIAAMKLTNFFILLSFV